MAVSMTTSELQQAQAMIDGGDLAGFYSFMADQGCHYALLVGELISAISCRPKPGGPMPSSTGRRPRANIGAPWVRLRPCFEARESCDVGYRK